MTILKNPFGVRNGVVIFVDDLSPAERGNACQCHCPHCEGAFVAKMGEEKVHHFAHNKGACDEVKAYLSGLHKIIQQILSDGNPFYVPDLVVSYDLPENRVLTTATIQIKYVSTDEKRKNTITVHKGQHIVFDKAELSYAQDGYIQAIELKYADTEMAVKVMPPDIICKSGYAKYGYATPHKNMTTLILDFENDGEKIQKFYTETFKEYLLSDSLEKRWVFHDNAKRVYPQIIERSEWAYEKYKERLKQEEQAREFRKQRERELIEQRKKEQALAEQREQELLEQRQKERELAEQRRQAMIEEREKAQAEKLRLQRTTAEEKIRIGYEQVKDLFVQQKEPIVDEFNFRWVQCEICGEIKRTADCQSYGGWNTVNTGKCYDCVRNSR